MNVYICLNFSRQSKRPGHVHVVAPGCAAARLHDFPRSSVIMLLGFCDDFRTSHCLPQRHHPN